MSLQDLSAQPLLASPRHSSSSSYSSSYSPSSSPHDASKLAAVTVSAWPSTSDSLAVPETSSLGRTLSWQSAYILIISRVIGTGIFATPGAILVAANSVGLSLSLWVVGSLIAACSLAVSLEFGCMLPRSGGDKVYLEFTYPRPRFLASTVIAVQVVLLGISASNCVIFSEYVLFVFRGREGGEASDWLRKGVATGLLLSITVLHGVFPKAGVRMQDWFGWIKLSMIGCMVLSGLYVVVLRPSVGTQAVDLSWGKIWEGSAWNWGTIATSLFKVLYSYSGLDSANLVLNEVKDPVRTLRFVNFLALATACGLYLLVNVAYFIVIPVQEIKDAGELIAGLFFEKIFGPGVGRTVLPLAVALSAMGNVLVVVFAQSRLKQEIARQGFLPFSSVLASTKPFGSPLGGLLVHFIPSFLVIVLPPSKQVYSFILEVEGYPGQFLVLLVGGGLVWLRHHRPDLHRPFKAWLPAVALRLIFAAALLAAPFFPPKAQRPGEIFYATYAIVGTGIWVLAVVYWYVWTRLLPRLRRYELVEISLTLDDGTAIKKLEHVPYRY